MPAPDIPVAETPKRPQRSFDLQFCLGILLTIALMLCVYAQLCFINEHNLPIDLDTDGETGAVLFAAGSMMLSSLTLYLGWRWRKSVGPFFLLLALLIAGVDGFKLWEVQTFFQEREKMIEFYGL